MVELPYLGILGPNHENTVNSSLEQDWKVVDGSLEAFDKAILSFMQYIWPRTTRETDVKLQNHGKKCEDGLRFLQPFPQKLMMSFHFFCKSAVILSTIVPNYQLLKM